MENTIDPISSVRRIALPRKVILSATNLHDGLAVLSATQVHDALSRNSEPCVDGSLQENNCNRTFHVECGNSV